jgi:tetrahydromethanopterin S-methyltransferase subunit B
MTCRISIKSHLFLLLMLLLICSVTNYVNAQTPKEIQKDIQEIKERLARLEERVNSLDKGLNNKD